jgi:hypothetical protein
MGVVDASPLRLAEGRRRGMQTSQRARRDRLEWAQARGLDARLHLLGYTEHRQVLIRACGTAEAS